MYNTLIALHLLVVSTLLLTPFSREYRRSPTRTATKQVLPSVHRTPVFGPAGRGYGEGEERWEGCEVELEF